MSKTILRVILFTLLSIGIALAVIYRDSIDTIAVQNWIEQSGALAPLLFMLVYVLPTGFATDTGWRGFIWTCRRSFLQFNRSNHRCHPLFSCCPLSCFRLGGKKISWTFETVD